jgi:CO dehydrogenase/acetyl-CoA synthase alpha subunit
LQNCTPCQECLAACPIFSSVIAPAESAQTINHETAVRWLVSCVSCGMCEQACPDHLPLAAIFRRISQDLKEDIVPA